MLFMRTSTSAHDHHSHTRHQTQTAHSTTQHLAWAWMSRCLLCLFLCGTAAWHAFFFVNKTLKFGVKFLVGVKSRNTFSGNPLPTSFFSTVGPQAPIQCPKICIERFGLKTAIFGNRGTSVYNKPTGHTQTHKFLRLCLPLLPCVEPVWRMNFLVMPP